MNCFHSPDKKPFRVGDWVRCHWRRDPLDISVYVVTRIVKDEEMASGWAVQAEIKTDDLNKKTTQPLFARTAICGGWFVRSDGRKAERPVPEVHGADQVGASGGEGAAAPDAEPRVRRPPQPANRAMAEGLQAAGYHGKPVGRTQFERR